MSKNKALIRLILGTVLVLAATLSRAYAADDEGNPQSEGGGTDKVMPNDFLPFRKLPQEINVVAMGGMFSHRIVRADECKFSISRMPGNRDTDQSLAEVMVDDEEVLPLYLMGTPYALVTCREKELWIHLIGNQMGQKNVQQTHNKERGDKIYRF